MLPFTAFGEAATLGLKAYVYCPTCYTTRRLDLAAEHLRDRCFAGTRFRCTNVRWTGKICGAPGTVTIRPTELLPVGGAVHLAFLWCNRRLPPWQISYIPIHQPAWNIANSRGARSRGDRFRCPGCQGRCVELVELGDNQRCNDLAGEP